MNDLSNPPKPPKPPKRPALPVRSQVSYDVAHRAASIGCTMEEIATMLGIGAWALDQRRERDPELKEAIECGRNEGRHTLRRMQWELAEQGNATMLIWLGKQLLGQRDKNETNAAINSDIRVVVELVGEPRATAHVIEGKNLNEGDGNG